MLPLFVSLRLNSNYDYNHEIFLKGLTMRKFHELVLINNGSQALEVSERQKACIKKKDRSNPLYNRLPCLNGKSKQRKHECS